MRQRARDGGAAGRTGPGHDHDLCIADALEAAARVCAARGQRLTPIRRRVLELVWQSHSPIGAYEIMRRLGQGRPAAPPTVYRALDFLVAQHLVHRINSRNAFIGCAYPERQHDACFLLCENCGSADELSDAALLRALAEVADSHGFAVTQQTVELRGRCRQCRDGSRA
ncbi:MAG: transcriptional repressor [Alphaproteobacteria bacterium]|nr:transcriptional repressor [Alphaproteobacteria bacterium]